MISEEKLEWMKKVGMRKFPRPMLYSLGMNHVYSEEYISNTPLEELKAKYNERLIRKGTPIANDKDLEERIAELEGQVQEQPKEKFIPEDSNGKHYGNNKSILKPNSY